MHMRMRMAPAGCMHHADRIYIYYGHAQLRMQVHTSVLHLESRRMHPRSVDVMINFTVNCK